MGINGFFAAIGLAVIAFGIGSYVTALNYPEEERYQSYRYAADKPLEIDPTLSRQTNPKPFEYRTPCDEPKGYNESDLCAQWRAANAAENSALWAKWSFWAGSFGVVGLLWTIIQGRIALERAREANELARDEFRAGYRPRLTINPIGPLVDPQQLNDCRDGGVITIALPILVRNEGSNPARLTRFVVELTSLTNHVVDFQVDRILDAKQATLLLDDMRIDAAVAFEQAADITQNHFAKLPIDRISLPKGTNALRLDAPMIFGFIEYVDDINVKRRRGFGFNPMSLLATGPMRPWGGDKLNYERILN